MAEKGKGRFRRIFVLTLAVLVVGGGLYVLRGLKVLTGEPTIKIDYLAQYNETSRPQDYDEKDNAAQLYQDALDCFTQMSEQSQNILPERHLFDPQWPAQLDAQAYRTLVQWLDSNKQALEYASEAAVKPYYWVHHTSKDNSVLMVLLPNLSEFKDLARAMILQGIVDAEQGRYGDAFERLRHSYLTGRHRSGNGSLIEQLVSMAIIKHTFGGVKLILTEADVPPDQIESFHKFLEEQTAGIGPLDLALERLSVVDLVQRVFTDDGEGNGHLIMSEFRKLLYDDLSLMNRRTPSIAKHGLKRALEIKLDQLAEDGRLYQWCARNDDRKTTLEKTDAMYAFFDEMAGQTPWEIQSKGTSFEQLQQKAVDIQDNFFIRAILPAVRKVLELHHEQICRHQALLTILALYRYEMDHRQYPATLEHLIDSGYMETLPMDPYSDGGLIYRRTQDGFILYSLGRNFKDDGGKHKEASDKKNFDLVFWPIWKPERQAPATEPASSQDAKVEYF